MNPKLNLRIAIIVLLSVFSFSALAAPKDGAAQKKIDEAINVHYLATEFDKAEGMLLGVIKACGTGCSPNVVAKAYMYIGLVRGCGKNNLAGAKDAFEKAKAADPGVQLDSALATPEVTAEFSKVTGGGGGSATAAKEPPAAAAGGGDVSLTCTPAAGSEIQTRQPIPVNCTVPAGVTKGELKYKAANGEAFKTVPMRVESKSLRAQIPCDGVGAVGSLSWYVIAMDAKGETVDTTGNEAAPGEFNIVDESSQPAPAFPGSQPPGRCGVGAAAGVSGNECPPGMPGCKSGGGWGDSCTPADKCKAGLYCASGTCENAPSCEVNADCDSGRCTDNFCEMGDSGGSSGGGKFRRWKVGIHFAPDLWITSATKNVCGADSTLKGTYTCYQAGQNTINTAPDGPDSQQIRPLGISEGGGFAGNVNSGIAMATIRALLSVDYALSPNVTVGGRAGMAFRGGPPSIKYKDGAPEQTTKFFPLHIEARAAYWFKALSMKGLHPYIHIGGGMAQVDGKVTVPAFRHAVTDQGCVQNPGPTTPQPQGCVQISPGQYRKEGTVYYAVKYDAWRKMGQGFGTLGGGVLFPLGDTGGVQVNLNIMFMLPSSGTVLEPSLGYVLSL